MLSELPTARQHTADSIEVVQILGSFHRDLRRRSYREHTARIGNARCQVGSDLSSKGGLNDENAVETAHCSTTYGK